ncbi:hypothetical protein BJ165DRAFT_180761 [Panaeolus papilionaceus]|nr:hypothetical protein BJ165DRAFT_180761 [Panaeolus papilionaceus]
MASSSSQNPIFPLEIFHLVLKNLSYVELDEYDVIVENLNIADLRQCSLVCRAWVPICQAHLFECGHVDSHSSTSGHEEGIIAAIAEHPKLASYVRKIYYSIVVGDQDHHPDESEQYVSTLLALPNLHSIGLVPTKKPDLGFFGQLSTNFDRLFAGDFVFFRFWEAYMSSTSLRDLALKYIKDVPLATFLSYPNLRSLTLNCCECADWPVSTTTLRTSNIESLELRLIRNISYAFLGFLPLLKKLSTRDVRWQMPSTSRDRYISTFRGLKKFILDDGWGGKRDLWVYIPLSTATEMSVKLFEHLQHFTILPRCEEAAEEIHQALRHAPNIHYLDVDLTKSSLIRYLNLHRFLPQSVGHLKTIHIRFSISDAGASQCRDTIKVLSESLALVRSPASLKELAMTVTIETTHLLTLFGMVPQLKMLDSVLFISSSMFPLLRWITFHICVHHYGSSEGLPTIDDDMKEGLYACIESSFEGFKRRPKFRLSVKLWLEHEKVYSLWDDGADTD